MHLSDIAPHDITRDLILFNQQRIAEVRVLYKYNMVWGEVVKSIVPDVLADGDYLPTQSGGRESQSANTEGTAGGNSSFHYFPEIKHVVYLFYYTSKHI